MVAKRDPIDSGPAVYPGVGTAGELGLTDYEAAIEPIYLTNIDGAKVLRALMNGAMRCLAEEAVIQGEKPAGWLHEASVTEAKALLKGLRDQTDKTELPQMAWDDQQLEGVPELPGFQPFSRVMTAETIAALDKRYGEGFTANHLQELIAQRDRKLGVGRVAIEASTEDNSLADNPDNEFYFRMRDGQLYIGDIPFMYWYGLLHSTAVNFIQQQRLSGHSDLPNVQHMSEERFDELDAYLEQKTLDATLPPLIMRTRTGLPDITSDDQHIDLVAINKTLHDIGYPRERNFAYDALLPALEKAPRPNLCGPLIERVLPPRPETPTQRMRRLRTLLESASPASSLPNSPLGDADTTTTATYHGDQRTAPDTITFGDYASEEPTAVGEDLAHPKPSGRTRQRILELNDVMYQSSGPISWTKAGLERWGQFIILGAQRLSRH